MENKKFAIKSIIGVIVLFIAFALLIIGSPIKELSSYKRCDPGSTMRSYNCGISLSLTSCSSTVDYNCDKLSNRIAAMFEWDYGRLYVLDKEHIAVVEYEIQSGPEYNGSYYDFYEYNNGEYQLVKSESDTSVSVWKFSIFVILIISAIFFIWAYPVKEKKYKHLKIAIIVGLELLIICITPLIFLLNEFSKIGSQPPYP